MQWILNNYQVVLTVLLVVSEAAAAVCQVAFPKNQGASGIIAAMIKALQSLGVKDPTPAIPSDPAK